MLKHTNPHGMALHLSTQPFLQEERKIAAEAAAKAAEEAAAQAAEEALLTVVVKDGPVSARPYHSATADTSAEEVQSMLPAVSRPKLRLRLQRRRREFGKRVALNSRNAAETTSEFRSRKDANFEAKPVERDCGFQFGSSSLSGTAEASSQTDWFRPLPRAVQTSPVGAASTGVPEQGTREHAALLSELAPFLSNVLNGTEYALSQNETLNIFQDELSRMHADGEASSLGEAGNAQLVERRMYMSLALSKDKTMPAVGWHPSINQWVAVAVTPRLSFSRALARMGRATTHHVLLFTTREFSSQIVLASPYPVSTFAWHPSKPATIAAGCASGHVMLFDMGPAFDARHKKRGRRGSAGAGINHEAVDPESAAAAVRARKIGEPGSLIKHGEGGLIVSPCAVSQPEHGHTRGVVSLSWLPADTHVVSRGKALGPSEDGVCHQFITAGGDGKVLVWDERYRELALSRPGARRTTAQRETGDVVGGAPATELMAAAPSEVPWVPAYGVGLHGAGSALAFTHVQFDRHVAAKPLYGVTETGQFVCAEWAPAGHAEGSAAALGGQGGGNTKKDKERGGGDKDEEGGARVLWLSEGTDRPGTCVLRSPFFEDVLLDVNEWSFRLWLVGVHTPLFVSPVSAAMLTSAAWSPTRPSVLFLGRADGTLEVWDFADTTLRPSTLCPGVATEPITCLDFRQRYASDGVVAPRATAVGAGVPAIEVDGGDDEEDAPPVGAGGGPGSVLSSAGVPTQYSQHFLAVGDAKGHLHVMEVPLALHRPSQAEQQVMAGWVRRESKRVAYFARRWAVRGEELAAAERAKAEAAAAVASAEAVKDTEMSALRNAVSSEYLSAGWDQTEITDVVLERIAAERASAKAEAEYRALQSSLIEQLELDVKEYWGGKALFAGAPEYEGRDMESKS